MTGPTAATKLLAAKPGTSVRISYGCFPEAHLEGFTDEQKAALQEAVFVVDKTEGDKKSRTGVIRISGHIGDEDNRIAATATVYKRYGRLALLRLSV
jgi:hypothetical protein